MNNVKVRKLALCEVNHVVIQPGEPYIFEAVPGCKKCVDLLDEANKTYSKDFGFADPEKADLPIYATRSKLEPVKKSSKKK